MDGSWMDAATLGLKYSASIIVKRLERTHSKRTVFRTPTWLRPRYMGPGLQITGKIEVRAPADEVKWRKGMFSEAELLKRTRLKTPCYVYFERTLRENCERASALIRPTKTEFLYSMKSLELAPVLKIISEYVDGFAASSLFEARLARDILKKNGHVHLTTPGLRPDEIPALTKICSSITFNSLRQYNTLKGMLPATQEIALRINPQHRIVEDEDYDPCCDNSRLGVTLAELLWQLERNDQVLAGFSGIHFHTNCEGKDFQDLEDTVNVITDALGDHMKKVEWINLGGGYHFDNPKHPEAFQRVIEKLKAEYRLETYFEPGGGIVNSAGYLVSSVLDVVGPIHSKTAILDTTVNHLPECLEFDYEPDVFGDQDAGHEYTLAGSSCLASDVFGEYAFGKPLKCGEQVVMQNVGAYSHVKCHSFNGLNIPTIYMVDENQNFSEIVSFDYSDFARKNGIGAAHYIDLARIGAVA
jgi:carboxynorspermidine decarboxylase